VARLEGVIHCEWKVAGKMGGGGGDGMSAGFVEEGDLGEGGKLRVAERFPCFPLATGEFWFKQSNFCIHCWNIVIFFINIFT